MKKSFFTLIAFLLCFQIAGISQKSRVGITSGANIAYMKTVINGMKEDNHNRSGLMFGMLVDVPLGSHVVFRPNLSYVQKGKKKDVGGGINRKRIYDALRYAEISFNFLLKTSGGDGSFFVGAGPNLDFNVSSKRITEATGSGGTRSTADVKFGKTSAEDYRGFDYGANFLTGYTTSSGWIFAFNYNQGFRNLVTGNTVGKIRNYYFGIQVGVLIKNK